MVPSAAIGCGRSGAGQQWRVLVNSGGGWGTSDGRNGRGGGAASAMAAGVMVRVALLVTGLPRALVVAAVGSHGHHLHLGVPSDGDGVPVYREVAGLGAAGFGFHYRRLRSSFRLQFTMHCSVFSANFLCFHGFCWRGNGPQLSDSLGGPALVAGWYVASVRTEVAHGSQSFGSRGPSQF